MDGRSHAQNRAEGAGSGQAPSTASSRRWRGLSIAIKLPLGVVLLLTLASATLSAAAYWHVRQLAFDVASERLNLAATQLELAIGPGLQQRLVALRRVTANPDVVSILGDTDDRHLTTVRAILTAMPPANGRSGFAVLDANGKPLLTQGSLTADDFGVNPPSTPNISAAGPLRRDAKDASLFYDLVLPIGTVSASGPRLLERRWLATSAPGLNLLTGLIGPQARLLLGNRDGSLWTDFHGSNFSLASDASKSLVHYTTASGQAFVAREVDIRSAPWTLGVSMPIAPVLYPADRFLWRALWVTTAIVVLGAVAGWRFSRRLIRPLRQLTEATESIASPAAEVSLERQGDEVMRLTASFAEMTARVEDSHRQLQLMVDELESRVHTRTAALEAANGELEAFSYSVSHDLRAPIRAIASFANILLEDHSAELSAEARRCIDVVIKRAKHMGLLIDDLLTFSRLGRQPIMRQMVPMTPLCAAVVAELNAGDAARTVDVSIAEMPDACAEPVLLRQVMTNLVQNALKYTRQQPAARIEIGSSDVNGEHVYYVKDNGVGFDMQYADRLFGVFQRLHRQEDFEGTGVGLAIVQRIVHRHGGRVWADAVVNGGATFFFTIALPDADAKEAA